eukprot:1325759-Alexandrium_andersonii.AAC.1
MSASLVGSEMCIRDSPRRRRCTCAPARRGTPRGNRRCSRGSSSRPPSGTVSYTHLTLPTICSV